MVFSSKTQPTCDDEDRFQGLPPRSKFRSWREKQLEALEALEKLHVPTEGTSAGQVR